MGVHRDASTPGRRSHRNWADEPLARRTDRGRRHPRERDREGQRCRARGVDLRLDDQKGRAIFVFGGGGAYGLISIAIPSATWLGNAAGTAVTLPLLGSVPAAYFPLVGFSALLGIADAFREPASMALFADEGDGEGVASSFGIRELIWRPGSVAGPLLGGWLMAEIGMAWVFYVGGAFAVTGALTFLAMLVWHHGPGGLREW